MEAYGLFLIKSVTVLSVHFGFYWFFLRNETYFSWNRLFLLGAMVLSIIVPFLKFHIHRPPEGTITFFTGPVIISDYLASAESIKTFGPLNLLSIIYIGGAVFFCLRLFSGIAKIHFLYFRFPKCRYNGFRTVLLDSDQSPFSFFNILFLSRNDFDKGGIGEMIAHEKAHKEAFHTFDVLLLEVLTIVQWFNPLVWMLRRALKSEHEFVADDRVLDEGFDKVKYQKMLFERSLGLASFNLTNSFNYSLLKKRLKMMTTLKSKSIKKIKYLVSIPVMLITIILMVANADTYGQKDDICTDADVMAMYKGKEAGNEVRDDLAKLLIYPKSAKDNQIAAKVYVQFVVDEKGKIMDVEVLRTDILDGANVSIRDFKPGSNAAVNESVADLQAEAVRAVRNLDDFIPAQKDGRNVKVQFTFPVNFALK